MMYSKASVDKIKAVTLNQFFPWADNKGNKYYCQCPACKGEGKVKSKWQGLTITVDPAKGKNRADCYKCGFKANGPVQMYAFLHNLDCKRDYPEIIKGIAEELGISIEEESEAKPKQLAGKPIPGSFAYRQLKESGLTVADITAVVEDGDKLVEIPVFQKGSLNVATGAVDHADDEMLILYYDLNGRRKKYMPKGARSAVRERDYTRVRWSNPDAHLDKNEKPIKYQTPSGAHADIYIPQKIREAYKSRQQFETLIVQEGEKKAEKACKHGLMSVGIQGIFNIGTVDSGLPKEIQYIAQNCGVRNIVLMFDSDWQDLNKNLDNDDEVDERPNLFSKAAIKFRLFVKTLHQIGIHVNIWFGHVNKNNADAKGIDDLLCSNLLEGEEDKLKKDLEVAMAEPSGIGEFLSVHNISTASDFQIRDFWKLNYKDHFFEQHKERLLKLSSFKFGKVIYNVVDNEFKQASEYGSGNEFWYITQNDKGDRKVNMSIIDTKSFLEGNGFCFHIDEEGNNTFVRIDRGVIYKMRVPDIHRFVFSYVCKATRDKEIQEYFANSLEGRLTQGRLNLLNPLVTSAGIPEQYIQRFYYRNAQIAIDENGVTVEPLKGPVWEQNLIKRDFSRVRIFEDVTKLPDGSFRIIRTEAGEECEFLTYLMNTSSFVGDDDVERLDVMHLINKITCIGYLLRQFRSHIEKKAVVAMDTRMSEVGDSNGRSGKSLVGVAISKMIEQVSVDGRTLSDSDNFIFNDVRKTTGNVFIDDIKVNFELGLLYAAITGDLNVNVKQGKRFILPFEYAPKIYITTNHSIRSEGESTEDRIIFMGFSPHYNTQVTPASEFGHQFFIEWDDRQWTLFDNLMIECVEIYMQSIKLGWTKDGCGAIPPPMGMIDMRRERQDMGEAFLQWAESYFAPEGDHINTRIPRKEMYQDFLKEFPGQQRFVSPTNFKRRLKSFCRYKKFYHINPHKKHEKLNIDFETWRQKGLQDSYIGIEEKSAGIEFFTVADDRFFENTTPGILSARKPVEKSDDYTF